MNEELIKSIQKRAANPKKIHDMSRGMSPVPVLSAPAALEQIRLTEAALGFDLPPVYKDVVGKIANGSFGPGYGMFGVEGGHGDFDGKSLLELYVQSHTPGAKGYLPLLPEKMLPLCNWGCGMYSCMDCTDPAGPVYYFNPDIHVLDDDGLESTFIDADGTKIWVYQPNLPDTPVEEVAVEEDEDDYEDENEDEDEFPNQVCLIPQRGSFEEWISDWAKGTRLMDM